jgi:hypothetical protein
MAVAAGTTAVLAFALGFGLAVTGGDDESPEQAVAPTTVTVPPSSVTTVTSTPTTSAPETTAAPETAPPTEPPTTEPPPTQAPVVTEPPVTVAPARLVAQYNSDSANRLVMSRGGTASLTLTNVGGSIASWLVQASGYVFIEGVSSGTLQPGQSVTIRLRGAPDVPPVSPQGNLIISGGSDGQQSIAVLVL